MSQRRRRQRRCHHSLASAAEPFAALQPHSRRPWIARPRPQPHSHRPRQAFARVWIPAWNDHSPTPSWSGEEATPRHPCRPPCALYAGACRQPWPWRASAERRDHPWQHGCRPRGHQAEPAGKHAPHRQPPARLPAPAPRFSCALAARPKDVCVCVCVCVCVRACVRARTCVRACARVRALWALWVTKESRGP